MRLTKKQQVAKTACLDMLKKCQENGDRECAHEDADAAICDLLESLGFGDVVSEYSDVAKWFA